MRGIMLFLVALGLISVCFLDRTRAESSPATQPSDLAAENQRLKTEVNRLQMQVYTLQRELLAERLKSPHPVIVPPPKQPFSLTPAPQSQLQMPPGSVQREFNGVSYYLVPLGPGGATAAGTSGNLEEQRMPQR